MSRSFHTNDEPCCCSPQSQLVRTDQNRWAIFGNGIDRELTSGDVIEVLIGGRWVRTGIECSGSVYYATTAGLHLMSGLPARLPEQPLEQAKAFLNSSAAYQCFAFKWRLVIDAMQRIDSLGTLTEEACFANLAYLEGQLGRVEINAKRAAAYLSELDDAAFKKAMESGPPPTDNA
jgi:Domain of unknown function (DUF5348)